ncbi:MAG: sulfite exporter TauE/SafE family protein [Cohaesibacter sp.]|nr:sulfite exporter TauE/SafE family protein [Cohaesibacter sp.]
MFDLGLLISAAFLAGILNAIAGGGSFLTFPALVFVGVPPIPANATSAVAVFPGYLSSTLGFLSELKAHNRQELILFVLLSIIGGVAGAVLLMVTPSSLFNTIVPWLLLIATALFAFDKVIRRWSEAHQQAGADSAEKGFLGASAGKVVSTLVVTTYGGYFNGGLGIILLALFSSLGMRDIHVMNGLKNGLSFILSAASVLTFALAGLVFWKEAIIMMLAATVGGYAGAHLARLLPASIVRTIVILVGLGMSIAFFLR